MAPKTSRTTKKVLMATGATHAPEVIERRFWPESYVAKDYFWAQVEKNKTAFRSNSLLIHLEVPFRVATKLPSGIMRRERASWLSPGPS